MSCAMGHALCTVRYECNTQRSEQMRVVSRCKSNVPPNVGCRVEPCASSANCSESGSYDKDDGDGSLSSGITAALHVHTRFKARSFVTNISIHTSHAIIITAAKQPNIIHTAIIQHNKDTAMLSSAIFIGIGQRQQAKMHIKFAWCMETYLQLSI